MAGCPYAIPGFIGGIIAGVGITGDVGIIAGGGTIPGVEGAARISSGPTIFVLGNEGSGVSKEVLDQCDGIISVPMKDNVESLNVAMTGTLLLYETVRQRILLPRS